MRSKTQANKSAPHSQASPPRLTRAELLESMLDPQAKVAPGYGIQILELNDGTTVTGTQMSESNEAIVIKSPDGKLTTHPKATVKTAGKPIGVMPPMKALLTTREMRDLVEFLSSLNDAEWLRTSPLHIFMRIEGFQGKLS